MYQVSTSVARRIPWHQTIELGYVGTFGRNLTAKSNINAIQPGGLSTRYPDPLVRAALTDGAVNAVRPFPAYGNLFYLQNVGRVGLPLAAGDAEPPVRRLHLPGRLHALQERGHHGCGLRPHRPARPHPLPGHARHRPHALRHVLVDLAPGRPGPRGRLQGCAAQRLELLGRLDLRDRPADPAGLPRRHRRRPGGPRLVGHAGLRQLRPDRWRQQPRRHHAHLHLRPDPQRRQQRGRQDPGRQLHRHPRVRSDRSDSSRRTTSARPRATSTT